MFDFEKGSVKFILGGKYPHCHTVFVEDEVRALMDAASREDVLLTIQAQGGVDVLVVSHGHEDHIMYNYLFPKSRFWVHRADAHVFLDMDRLLDGYAPTEEERERWRDLLVNQCHYEVRKADRLLEDGDVLEFGKTRCEVIHTPGHTPGHCAFHFPEERVLFLGDLDLVKAGPYYGDVASSLEHTLDSLKRLEGLSVDVYLTAHGKGIYPGDPAILRQYAEAILQRERALLDFLSQGPRTLEEITQKGIIYGPPRMVAGWDLSTSERAMMRKHLDKLMKEGRVFCGEDVYGLI